MKRIRKLILVLIAIAAVIVLYKPFVNASLEYQENRRRILQEKAAAEAQMAAAEEETEKELTAICKEYGGKSAVLYIEKTKKARTAKIVIASKKSISSLLPCERDAFIYKLAKTVEDNLEIEIKNITISIDYWEYSLNRENDPRTGKDKIYFYKDNLYHSYALEDEIFADEKEEREEMDRLEREIEKRLKEEERQKEIEKQQEEERKKQSGGSWSGKGYRSSRSSSKRDYYNAKDYRDPEDFYFDYEEDFEDEEDAEDYWDEYHG